MTDLTPFFSQCVTIYNESNEAIINQKQQHRQQQLKKGKHDPGSVYVQDTFNKECKELFNDIVELEKLVASVRPGYLLSNNTLRDFDDDSDEEGESGQGGVDESELDEDYEDLNAVLGELGRKGGRKSGSIKSQKKKSGLKAKFTEEERDVFDSQSNLLLHKFNQKLNHLENYESKRSEHLWFSKEFNNTDLNPQDQSHPGGNTFSLFKNYLNFTLKKSDYVNINNTIHKHREGVLSSISLELKKVSVELGNMQAVRLNRKLEEKSNELHLLNNNDMLNQLSTEKDLKAKYLEELDADENMNGTHNENGKHGNVGGNASATLSYNEQLQIGEGDGLAEDDNLKEYQSTIQSLSQTQLKKLELENSELLNNKLNELQKVKSLQQSASDIANLQRELSVHVETQTEQIKLLQDDQESAELDVLRGNRELKKAKIKSRRSSLIIIYASIILGFLLLFFDAVII